MKPLPFSKIRFYIIISALLLLAGGFGYSLGERRVRVGVSPDKQIVVSQDTPPNTKVDFSLFWDVWTRMFRYYIDAPSLDSQKMVWGAITGMVAAADDPYTTFLPPKENKEFKEEIGGAFEGIGAQLGIKENRIIVIAPLKGTPAEKAGIQIDDIITKIGDQELSDKNSLADVIKKKKAGESISLEIWRNGSTLTFSASLSEFSE